MTFKWLVALMIAVAGLAVSPASAKVVTVTYTGVANGFDQGGIFGKDISYFDDANFTAKFKYDLTSNSSVVKATLTIDGSKTAITVDPANQYSFQDIELFDTGNKTLGLRTLAGEYRKAIDPDVEHPLSTYKVIDISVVGINPYMSSLQNILYDGDVTSDTQNLFLLVKFDEGSGGFTFGSLVDLSVKHLNIAAAVPEPAMWLMMILGFGVVGGAMRASRRSSGAALAHA